MKRDITEKLYLIAIAERKKRLQQSRFDKYSRVEYICPCGHHQPFKPVLGLCPECRNTMVELFIRKTLRNGLMAN